MLKHHNDTPLVPKRTVVLGSAGFIGQTLVNRLSAAGVNMVSLAKQDLDLETPAAATQLTELLHADDTLVFISAKAPVRDVSMLAANLRMAETVVAAVSRQAVAHVI